MSGLLVKSVAVMKENLEEMNARGVAVPVLLGGAALTKDYAVNELASLYKGKLFYCRDAFAGLGTMDRIVTGEVEQAYDEQQREAKRRAELRERAVKPQRTTASSAARSDVRTDNPVPAPPFWGRREVSNIPLEQVFPYINETALFVGQWGFRKKGMRDAEYEQVIAEKARPVFESLQQRALKEKLLTPMVVYGYFPVQSDGDELIVYHVESFQTQPREWVRFGFPRQADRRRLCIADFFRAKDSGQYDVLGVQLVTVGTRASDAAQELFKANRYQDYLYLHGFGVESAEALAELWHKRMRQELGFGSEDSPKVRELLQQGYRGSRYSFGYPACPNLEDRAKLIELLRPESIGVTLSENFMLVPEQSTDAIVVHHPQAKYFDT
jgi:5-methyltetrahydrofolate--homocysteine methyltransferase